jgi:hypothetical protein
MRHLGLADPSSSPETSTGIHSALSGRLICSGTLISRSPPTGRDAGAYNIITGTTPPVNVAPIFAEKYQVDAETLPDFKLLDLRAAVPRHAVGTNYATFTGFTEPNNASIWSRIDFVFGGNNGGWCVVLA